MHLELRYGRFSEGVLEIIRRIEQGLEDVRHLFAELERVAREFAAEQRAHEDSGLSETGYGMLEILEALQPGGTPKEAAEGRLPALAEELAGLCEDDAVAGWHLKEQLKKELRQAVRLRAHQAGLGGLKELAARIEDFALKHCVKLA